MVVTSPDQLHRDWRKALESLESTSSGGAGASHVERLLAQLPDTAGLVTVLDGHPATLSWLGAVRRQRMIPLGVDRFGQSGDIPDLYREHGIYADAIVSAAARLVAPRP